MKKIITVLMLSSFAVVSCNSGSEKHEETAAADTATTAPAAEATASTTSGQIDPVCEMDRDTSWTEHTVYNNDTVWFCSDNCKTAFSAHPEKYADKLVKK